MPIECRGVPRPRPSLSCVLCRQRKVRCNRKQPACNNCLRMNEVCQYDNNNMSKSNVQAQGKRKHSVSNNSGRSRGREVPAHQDVDWTDEPHKPAHPQRDITEDANDFGSWGNPYPKSCDKAMPYAQGNVYSGSHDNPPARSISALNPHDPFIAHTNQDKLMDDFLVPGFWTAPVEGAHTNSSDSQLGDMHSWTSMATSSLPSPASKPRRDLIEGLFDQGHERSTSSVPSGLGAQCEQGNSSKGSSNHTTSNSYTASNYYPTSNSHTASTSYTASSFSPGYLSVHGGGQQRYVGSLYWALLKGYEPLAERFLRRNDETPEGVPKPHIDSLALANLLKLLPEQPVSNTLLYFFMVGVRPIDPLIHVPTFRTDYNNFWQWYLNLETSFPTGKLIDDPTYLCLLFTVLYCGAMSAPPSLWATGALQEVKKEKILEQLRTASSTSLEVCNYLKYPTFNTLVASLLRHSFKNLESKAFEVVGFVCVVVRIAQSMGLHREGSQFGLNTLDCEMRRRVWWHILWLDLQNSILTGTPTCCGSHGAHEVQMVSGARDRDLLTPVSGSLLSQPAGIASSASMLFAIGRFKIIRFERSLVTYLHTARGLEEDQIKGLKFAAQELQSSMDSLIAQFPAEGIPERGFIPSRLINVSPLTNEKLYGDALSEPTIFTSWARIMLAMFKTEVAILLQRVSLNRENWKSKQGQMKWKNVIQHCITYLSNFLQLLRIPSFAPYMWFCSTYFAPPQCVVLILTYLQQDRDPEIANLAFYFVDELINFFAPENQTSHPLASGKQSQHEAESVVGSTQETDRTWELLRAFRKSLDSSSPENSDPNQSNHSATAGRVTSQKQHHAGSHAGDSDIDMLHSASSTSDAWSSLTAWDVDRHFSFGPDLGGGNQIPNTSTRTTHFSPSIESSSASATGILDGSLSSLRDPAWNQVSSGAGKRTTRKEDAREGRERTGLNAERIGGSTGAPNTNNGSNGYVSGLSNSLWLDL